MANFVNPNSCDPATCALVFNADGEYEDPVLALGQLTLDDGTNTLKVCYSDILCGGSGATKTCFTEGTPKETTVTVVIAPDSSCCGNTLTYGITIAWKQTCSQFGSETFEVVGSGDAGDTVTTIADALVAEINTGNFAPVSAENTAGVITITADAAGIDFITSVSATVSGAITTVVATPNVNPFGSAADLAAMLPSNFQSQIAPGGTYSGVLLTYWSRNDLSTQDCQCIKPQSCWVFVQTNGGGSVVADVLTGSGALEDILVGDTTEGLTLGDFIGKQDDFCTDAS